MRRHFSRHSGNDDEKKKGKKRKKHPVRPGTHTSRHATSTFSLGLLAPFLSRSLLRPNHLVPSYCLLLQVLKPLCLAPASLTAPTVRSRMHVCCSQTLQCAIMA